MKPHPIPSVMGFYTAEALLIHTLCDKQDVPRAINGLTLSMAQRVTVLQEACARLIQRIGIQPTVTIH